MDYGYNQSAHYKIIDRFEKKIDVHPLGPHRSLRKFYFETGFYT